jgi:uncharacterized membrane protein
MAGIPKFDLRANVHSVHSDRKGYVIAVREIVPADAYNSAWVYSVQWNDGTVTIEREWDLGAA